MDKDWSVAQVLELAAGSQGQRASAQDSKLSKSGSQSGSQTQYHALIDTGALITGLTNQQVPPFTLAKCRAQSGKQGLALAPMKGLIDGRLAKPLTETCCIRIVAYEEFS